MSSNSLSESFSAILGLRIFHGDREHANDVFQCVEKLFAVFVGGQEDFSISKHCEAHIALSDGKIKQQDFGCLLH